MPVIRDVISALKSAWNKYIKRGRPYLKNIDALSTQGMTNKLLEAETKSVFTRQMYRVYCGAARAVAAFS